jgi:aspartyl-tRNA(Asn)/glutamyl-tRNA(Gln) amidotransferase subunit A
MKDLTGKSVSELRRLLDNKEVKAREIAEAHIAHAERFEAELGAYNCLTKELAISQADKVDGLISAGKTPSRLAGIPVALKDNICVPGYVTSCSSKILNNFKPAYQATVAHKLNDAGAIIIGKTNMDEFAMGSSTENSAFKITKNPWDLKRVPGGSSGGSACAVASGSAVLALGSDTGGSIRQPASFCGVVGMKPTYGTVSRFGLVAFASSLDQIGPFARNVEDLALILDVVSGHDEKDSTSYNESLPNCVEELKKPVAGLRIGLIKELIGEGIDEEVRKAILAAVETFKQCGAVIEEVSMPQLKHALPVYYLIATAEASANLARYDGVRYGHRSADSPDLLTMYFKTRQEGFGAEVKRRIMLGTYALSSGYYDAYYKKAQQVRRLIKEEFDKKFASFDLLISPTAPSTAFEIGAKSDDPLAMYLSDIATIPANLAGIPGVSLPCGFGEGGMPIGLQILAPALGDAVALRAAYAFEQATDFHRKHPQKFFCEAASHA